MGLNFDYYDRFKKEIIYLWNDEVECYIKSVPGHGYFIKFKGGPEKEIPADSKTVVLAIETKQEVTKEEYEKA